MIPNYSTLSETDPDQFTQLDSINRFSICPGNDCCWSPHSNENLVVHCIPPYRRGSPSNRIDCINKYIYLPLASPTPDRQDPEPRCPPVHASIVLDRTLSLHGPRFSHRCHIPQLLDDNLLQPHVERFDILTNCHEWSLALKPSPQKNQIKG